MIPVDEAIGQVLKEATPMEAATLKLADIPIGAVLRSTHSRCATVALVWCYCCSTTTFVVPCFIAAVNSLHGVDRFVDCSLVLFVFDNSMLPLS